MRVSSLSPTMWGLEIQLRSAGTFTPLSHFFQTQSFVTLKNYKEVKLCISFMLSINVGVWDLTECRLVGLNETFQDQEQ